MQERSFLPMYWLICQFYHISYAMSIDERHLLLQIALNLTKYFYCFYTFIIYKPSVVNQYRPFQRRCVRLMQNDMRLPLQIGETHAMPAVLFKQLFIKRVIAVNAVFADVPYDGIPAFGKR